MDTKDIFDRFEKVMNNGEECWNGHRIYRGSVQFNHFGVYEISGFSFDGGWGSPAPKIEVSREIEGVVHGILVSLAVNHETTCEYLYDIQNRDLKYDPENQENCFIDRQMAINLARWFKGILSHGYNVPFIRD